MKYYSDKTHTPYDTVEELDAAEKAFDEAQAKREQAIKERKEREAALKSERSKRAQEVLDAFKAIQEAERKYYDLRKKFVKDYGSFTMSYSSDDNISTISDLLFNLFF